MFCPSNNVMFCSYDLMFLQDRNLRTDTAGTTSVLGILFVNALASGVVITRSAVRRAADLDVVRVLRERAVALECKVM